MVAPLHEPEQSSDDYQRIALSLQKLIQLAHINEAELSRQTGIPQPTLHKILSGKTSDPRISTLKVLANYFAVPLDTLLSGEVLPTLQTIPVQSQAIPIITWDSCMRGSSYIRSLNTINWEKWLVTESVDTDAFALITRPCMIARFPKETVLIISQNLAPEDGDLILVHYSGTELATIRELSIDGPIKLLLPITPNANIDTLDEGKKILGVVVKSQFNYHSSK